MHAKEHEEKKKKKKKKKKERNKDSPYFQIKRHSFKKIEIHDSKSTKNI